MRTVTASDGTTAGKVLGRFIRVFGGPDPDDRLETWVAHHLNRDSSPGGFGMFWGPDGAWKKTLGKQRYRETEETAEQRLRNLVDQWIETGKSADGVADTPQDRDVTKVLPGYKQTLQQVLDEWLSRYPMRVITGKKGELWALDSQPPFSAENHIVFAHEMAIYWFLHLLNSATPQRLARCSNRECGRYFTYPRTPKGTIQRGTFCKARSCQGAGSTLRKISSRDERTRELVELAASFWNSWQPTNRMGHNKAEWIAKKINSAQKKKTITRKWVAQNTAAIEQYLATLNRTNALVM